MKVRTCDCGKRPNVQVIRGNVLENTTLIYRVYCSKCGKTTYGCFSRKDAIDSWDRKELFNG